MGYLFLYITELVDWNLYCEASKNHSKILDYLFTKAKLTVVISTKFDTDPLVANYENTC